MNDFNDLLCFYGIYQTLEDKSVSNVMSMINYKKVEAEEQIRKSNIITMIVKILSKIKFCSLADLLERTQLTKKETGFYLTAISALYPGLLSIKNIIGSTLMPEKVEKEKKKKALSAYIAAQKTDASICKALNVGLDEIETIKNNLPEIKEENLIVRKLRLENEVIEFFKIHPYSTIKEAAKLLGVRPQILRSVVEELRLAGEDIKFNNVPIAIEKEAIARKVIEIKTDEPALTTAEISLKLGISTVEVKNAIRDARTIWQKEKSDNYDFYINKTSRGLEEVKAVAWEQHKNSSRPSSRWLEIVLMAEEKLITMHGLKAPEKIDIRQEVLMTKNERDNIVAAAMATDAIDIDFTKVEVTREN